MPIYLSTANRYLQKILSALQDIEQKKVVVFTLCKKTAFF
jgi:hypothetical protein